MSQIDTTPVEPGVELKKERGYREEVQEMGEQLLATVKEVLHEGRSAPSYLAFMLHLSTVYRILWRGKYSLPVLWRYRDALDQASARGKRGPTAHGWAD